MCRCVCLCVSVCVSTVRRVCTCPRWVLIVVAMLSLPCLENSTLLPSQMCSVSEFNNNNTHTPLGTDATRKCTAVCVFFLGGGSLFSSMQVTLWNLRALNLKIDFNKFILTGHIYEEHTLYNYYEITQF